MNLACRLMRLECFRIALLCMRKPSLVLNPLLFFLLVITLFPLGLSPDLTILHQVGPGLVWVASLLSLLLGLDSLFQADFDTGVLEQLLLQEVPLAFYVFVKLLGFWFFSVLPLIVLTPLIGVMLHFTVLETGVLVSTLILGTPVICVLSGLLASLTVGLGRQSALLPLLLLPLTIPIVILGTGSVLMLAQGGHVWPLLLIMFSFCLVSITLGPLLISGTLKLLDY